jgi:hypothetical protein
MSITREEIQKYVKDTRWQHFRLGLQGLSTTEKLVKLEQWLREHGNSRASQVQVENYRNALRRGGLIK